MSEPLYPALYQINTRVWLTERSRALGRPASSYCRACFTGDYPIPVPDDRAKLRFEPAAV